jgi:plastocyanin
MGNIDISESNNILNASVTGATYNGPTTPINLALITTSNPSLNNAFGSEVSGGSYARQATTGGSNIWGSASGGSITNSVGSVSFTGMPACTIGGIELWDSQTRTKTDGVLNSTTTLTSATASFTAADIGRIVTDNTVPANIPTGTYIASVTNSTTVILSAAATATASGQSITIGPKRNWFGTLSANKTVNAGDTVTFATSSISITLS